MAETTTVSTKSKVLLIGAGAVGSTIATWIAPQHDEFYILDQGDTLEAIRQNGVSAYQQHQEQDKQTANVKIVATLAEAAELMTPDIIILCVKNYSLNGLAKAIYKQFGNDPIIVGLQNGVENQSVLPKVFTKVIYGIISYNAWLDAPGVAGFQKRGPIVIGTTDNSLQTELEMVQDLFSPHLPKTGVETIITHHLMDAALSKMIINLTNSFTTLIGFTFKPIADKNIFQTILSQLTYEGVKIVKAAGYKECKLGGMPSWFLIAASAKLPHLITRKLFEKNVSKMVISSMAQDVIQHHSADNELETINGFLMALAEKHNVSAPYNKAVYELCKQEFSKPCFEPMSIEDVWRTINSTTSPINATS
jgi:2-dehydropantoate 2-reductase